MESFLDRQSFLLKVLDSIESKESVLLFWGLVDAFLSREELNELVDPLIDEALTSGYEGFTDADKVVQALLDLKLITEVETQSDQTGFRSRMAETIRLLFRLRQLFPNHDKKPGLWQSAPTLVSDFRFQRRRRQYPRRDITKEEVLDRLQNLTSNTAILSGAKSLIDSKTSDFKFSGFQIRATERILNGLESGKTLGTIICAGTGSGKTLAVFLPLMAYVASRLIAETSKQNWVKVVAIYPRTELLKDQLRESIRNSIAIQKNLPNHSKVGIRIGALYGDTPHSSDHCNWRKVGKQRISPTLSCVKCGGELRWLDQNYGIGKEILTCRDCNFSIDSSVFPITRETLIKSPPDILFTTTEMLNQRLSDSRIHHLFGVGQKALHTPKIVLLDEVHTYEGLNGAQVGYLLRRWQHMLEESLSFVGLSATLREAQDFFSDLTSLKPDQIKEISPHSDETETEGAEYLVALKGDPVSRKALLSTTIQTTMLIGRCLDPKSIAINDTARRGIYGCRTFVFTDDLDVTNRLYFDLLDSEGRDSFGRPIKLGVKHQGGLACLREPDASLPRYLDGQDWRFCKFIGHDLSTRHEVERVSSQDRGVDSSAQTIVATAALEVGFDDPLVGAVVQHKAPRSAASFLQRKGRAGRIRGMRPWTLVVLSDYGRDRLAYSNYDQLFDPELPRPKLPLNNRYIARMQSVFATIDFFGLRLAETVPRGSVWQDLAEPIRIPVRANRLEKELRFILETEKGTRRLEEYLSGALNLQTDEILALLWEYPRPLMTVVLPTALRRITTKWGVGGAEGKDYIVRNNPLPEFVPGSLFADLNLTEVKILLPDNLDTNSNEPESMSALAAIREFAPGRVSRRFGIKTRTQRHWIGLTEDSIRQNSSSKSLHINIEDIGEFVDLGKFHYRQGDSSIPIQVLCPRMLKPTVPPVNLKDSSNAKNIWHSQFVPTSQPNWFTPPIDCLGDKLISKIGFFMHAVHAPVEVRRFTTTSVSDMVFGNPAETIRDKITFYKDNEPVALGFSLPVDGVFFQIKMPYDINKLLKTASIRTVGSLRTSRFFDRAWRGDDLPEITSPFLRDWLAQIYISALTYTAIEGDMDLGDASKAIRSGTTSMALSDVLKVLFQSNIFEPGEDEKETSDKLRQDIEELIKRPDIVEQLHEMSTILWEPFSGEWEGWLREVYQSTIASSILRAVCDLCPKIDPDTLSVDLDHFHSLNETFENGSPEIVGIWITENSPGGNGLVEEFMRVYSEDPRRFFSILRSNLGMGELELIDYQLTRLLELVVNNDSNSRIPELIALFRQASNHSDVFRLQHKLRSALAQERFIPFHGFLVSLWSRILRPQSSSITDHFLADIINRWHNQEERLGIEIDLRVVCYWLSLSGDIDEVVSDLGGLTGNFEKVWRMNAISGLLWVRGRTIRQSRLKVRNLFAELPPTERLLVEELIIDDFIRISIDSDDWMSRTFDHLSNGRLVTLTCNESQRNLLGEALNMLITNPVDMGYLRAYARFQGLRLLIDKIEADVELVEALQ